MKIRSDFVSNSSSCSFLIHLVDENDIENYKNLVELLKQGGYKVEWYIRTHPTILSAEIRNGEPNINDWAWCDVGEDTLDNIEALYDIEDVLNEYEHKFKVYQDKYAHYSIGKNIPNDLNFKETGYDYI